MWEGQVRPQPRPGVRRQGFKRQGCERQGYGDRGSEQGRATRLAWRGPGAEPWEDWPPGRLAPGKTGPREDWPPGRLAPGKTGPREDWRRRTDPGDRPGG